MTSIRQRFTPGPVLAEIEDLLDADVCAETALPVEGARVVLADYALLQHDFPALSEPALLAARPELARLAPAERTSAIRRILDRWLLREAALISTRQAAQTEVNSEITVGEAQIEVFRPRRYGRALVRRVRSEGAAGLLDLKGVGVAPDRKPTMGGPYTNGLLYLGRALLDLAVQWLIDEILAAAAPHLYTVPTYAVLDFGFDVRFVREPEKSAPAGVQVRRAHIRPFRAIELPAKNAPLEKHKLELEMLLRAYGVTSCTAGTSIDLVEEGGELRVSYAQKLKTNLTPEQLERARAFASGASLPLRFEGVNVQLSRHVGGDMTVAHLVDFGQYKFQPSFEHPVASLVRDRLLRFGGAIWPHEPEFVQPDPRLCVTPTFWETRESWEEIEPAEYLPFRNGTRLQSLAFGLARRFRGGEIDSEQVHRRLRQPVDEVVARWRAAPETGEREVG